MLAVFTVILGSLYPLGSIIQGKIADHVGLRATTFGAAALMALVDARDPPAPTRHHRRDRQRPVE